MKKRICVLLLILIVATLLCACDGKKGDSENTEGITFAVKLCGEKICSVEVYESALNGFKLVESEEKKMIESFMSSPYYIGRFTVGYAPDVVFRYGEGETGYWFDFGDMNVGYVVKDGDRYVAYSHSACFGYISDDEEDQAFIVTENFLTGLPVAEENQYTRSYIFVRGESYPVGYDWEELKEIFANYDIDESKLTIGAQLKDAVFGYDAYLTLRYEEDKNSLFVEVSISYKENGTKY